MESPTFWQQDPQQQRPLQTVPFPGFVLDLLGFINSESKLKLQIKSVKVKDGLLVCIIFFTIIHLFSLSTYQQSRMVHVYANVSYLYHSFTSF